jgi:hypothetical protein
MARGRNRKTEKGLSNENDMKAAVQLVIEQKQSIRKAAERFGLKFQTVFEYVKRQIFTQEQENTLVDYILNCSKMCYGQTIKNIKQIAYEMARLNNIPVPKNWKQKKEAGHE